MAKALPERKPPPPPASSGSGGSSIAEAVKGLPYYNYKTSPGEAGGVGSGSGSQPLPTYTPAYAPLGGGKGGAQQQGASAAGADSTLPERKPVQPLALHVHG